jgi:hypothetical protein
MGIVNNPIDHRCQMFRDTNDQSPSRQFVATQMHGAPRTDLHRRRPHPTERLHDSFNRRFIDACSSVALSTFPFARALVHRRTVDQVIDLLIRPPSRNRYRPNNAIARLAPVSSSPAPPIIELKTSAHISFGSPLAMISISFAASRIKRRFLCVTRPVNPPHENSLGTTQRQRGCGFSAFSGLYWRPSPGLTPTLRCPMFSH